MSRLNFKFLVHIDRRWIFFALAASVIIPLLWPPNLPITPSPLTVKFYDTIEKLPSGSYVCMSFDYGPGTKAECQPMAIAALHHLFRRKCKVVCLALWPEGSMFARESLREAASHYEVKEGVDYVNLGYKNGGEVVLKGVGEDFRTIFSTDLAGHRLEDLPIMQKVHGWDSFNLVCEWSIGRPGLAEFVRIVVSQYERPLLTGTTAVTTPEAYPFLNSGQVISLLGGMRGAAEYEVMLGLSNGRATRGISAQSISHFFIAALIILANVIYFLERHYDKANRTRR